MSYIDAKKTDFATTFYTALALQAKSLRLLAFTAKLINVVKLRLPNDIRCWHLETCIEASLSKTQISFQGNTAQLHRLCYQAIITAGIEAKIL
ncbi:MAG: hypothetical protein ACI9NY_001028 [Kiritimatiellia bacterium]|jgi:hypothetical protein